MKKVIVQPFSLLNPAFSNEQYSQRVELVNQSTPFAAISPVGLVTPVENAAAHSPSTQAWEPDYDRGTPRQEMVVQPAPYQARESSFDTIPSPDTETDRRPPALATPPPLELFPPLEKIARPTVPTVAAAYYLNRKPQTLRAWACLENGPLRPVRINGRLAWPVPAIRALLNGEAK